MNGFESNHLDRTKRANSRKSSFKYVISGSHAEGMPFIFTNSTEAAEGNTQTILLYPQNRLEKGWRVNEVSAFPADLHISCDAASDLPAPPDSGGRSAISRSKLARGCSGKLFDALRSKSLYQGSSFHGLMGNRKSKGRKEIEDILDMQSPAAVGQIRVFDKYDTLTKTCKGMCADGSMSPRCLARSVGAAQSRLSDQFIRTVVRWIRGGNSRNSSESTQIAYSSTSSSCVLSKTFLLVRSRYWLYQ